MEDTLQWRVDTCQLLNEIVNCALPRNSGILFQPLNIFKGLLSEVAECAIKINDPELNILMLRLGLYELPNDKINEAILRQQKLIDKVKKKPR